MVVLRSENPETQIAEVSTIPTWIKHFLLSLNSENTRRSYRHDLESFFGFCCDGGFPVTRLTDITEKHLLLWQGFLRNHHQEVEGSHTRVVQKSVARRMSALSSFLEFARRRKIIETNPASLIDRPRIREKSRTQVLTLDEVHALLSNLQKKAELQKIAKNERGYASAKLWFAVFHTLFGVGMRVEELCTLRICDLEVRGQFAQLHLFAKGGESHSPVLHEDTVRVLKEYIAEFRVHAGERESLFLRVQKSQTEHNLTQNAVYKMLKEAALEAGILKAISPHSCRATLATLLHNAGVPLGHIKTLLNHKRIATTAIYVKKANELEEAAATKIDILAD